MNISVQQFGELCDAVERAWNRWPAERGDDQLVTSRRAREGAAQIMQALGLEHDMVAIREHMNKLGPGGVQKVLEYVAKGEET